MKECERCTTELDEELSSKLQERWAFTFTADGSPITICRSCAKELTLIIGKWLGTEPMDDPVAWFLDLHRTEYKELLDKAYSLLVKHGIIGDGDPAPWGVEETTDQRNGGEREPFADPSHQR